MANEAWTCDVKRLQAFSDGVIVVSMTLLVLDVRLPDGLGGADGPEMLHVLAALWPKYFGYVLSFLVIAQYWVGYTQKFGRMRDPDQGFVWLNILFLLTIGAIPFATALLSQNHGQVATSLYAGTMVVIASILTVMWFYAERHGLVATRLARGQQWREVAGWIHIGLVFAASIGVAWYSVSLAKFTWLLLAVPVFQRHGAASPD